MTEPIDPATVTTPTPTHCEVCHQPLILEVLHSDKGWYVGTQCNCGPRDVASVYYTTQAQAQVTLTGWSRDWTTPSTLPMPTEEAP